MSKAWDILPPFPKTHPKSTRATKSKKKRSSNAGLFLICLIVILGFFFVYETNKTFIATPANLTTPIVTPVISPSPDSLLIKILNGSGRSEETKTVSDLITSAGFKINKTENALNLYESTIIYYQADQENQAKEMATLIAKYNPKLQQFSQSTSFDIIVVIGSE